MSSSANPWLDLAVNLVGTLVGVLIAFILGTSFGRYQQQQSEKLDRRRAMVGIRSELTSSLLVVSGGTNVRPEMLATLSRVALDSAVNSGKFQLLKREVRFKVADAYQKLEEVKLYARELASILPSGSGITRAEDTRRSELGEFIRSSFPGLLKLVTEAMSLIDSELPPEDRSLFISVQK